MEKRQQLYSGKSKTIFATDSKSHVIVLYRDDATAFNGVKKAQLENKGLVNNHFNAFIMQYLQQHGIATHFEKLLNDRESLIKHLKMIPIECIVRNYAAGGISKRLGLEEGKELNPVIFEFFLKDDALGDPMINESHIHTFGWATDREVVKMKELTFRINDLLKPLFEKAGMMLVDFKLEFGRLGDEIVLGDEFTPDGCRIWDKQTHEKLDKDRFRRDLGNVIESYQIAAQRLGITIPS